MDGPISSSGGGILDGPGAVCMSNEVKAWRLLAMLDVDIDEVDNAITIWDLDDIARSHTMRFVEDIDRSHRSKVADMAKSHKLELAERTKKEEAHKLQLAEDVARAHRMHHASEMHDMQVRLRKYQEFAEKLDYNEHSIMTIKNMDQTSRTLKNTIVRNTGLAQYNQIRFGQRRHRFDNEERHRLYDAFSRIQFIGTSHELKCGSIINWYHFLSTNRQNLGWKEPRTRVQMNWDDIYNDITIGSGQPFTRDVYIDCRFHSPGEIAQLFCDAQGVSYESISRSEGSP